ncbi:penicillin-binding protein [Streptacidiphilus sp. 4-A2]|nr:penicillin-binding protein [Streptacidiphilus sp. 4-A2]
MTQGPQGPGWGPADGYPDGPDGPRHPLAPDALVAEDRAEGSSAGRRERRRARKQARKAARKAKPWWRRAIPTWRMALGGVLTVLLLGIGAFVLLYLVVQVPDPNAAATAQSNVYYYADNKTEIGQTGEVNRVSVPISEIALTMQHAAVSAEDRTFYTNRGVSVSGMARAAWYTVSGRGLQGGSTITQQYVKNYYLNQDQNVARKAKEVFISLKVDQTESKDTIMAGYLNTSYFGRGAYGIQAAAQAYYGINASQLNAPQAAYLAALLQAPSAYDVDTATPAGKAAAVARWNYVMDGMQKLGWLTPAQRAAGTFPAVKQPSATAGVGGQAGYLIDIADQYLTDNNIVDPAQLAAGGWRITTTFVKGDQDALASAVKTELSDQLPNTAQAKDVRAAAGSVDPATGKLVAAYGGPDYATQEYNDATRTDIQVGSTFKAFDLAAALQQHATTQDGVPITPSTVYDGNSGRPVQGLPKGQSYAPPNEDDFNYGEISLRYAMMKSVNSVYAQEAADAGLGNVRNAAISAGLPPDTPSMSAGDPSLALGVATPNAIQMQARTPPSPTTGSRSPLVGAGPEPRRRRAAAAGPPGHHGLQPGHRRHRHLGPGGRGQPQRHRLPGPGPGPPGRRQDRHHRQQQVGLVRRLHPAAVDRDRPVRRRPEDPRPDLARPGHRRQPGQRRGLPHPDLDRLHDLGPQRPAGRPVRLSSRRGRHTTPAGTRAEHPRRQHPEHPEHPLDPAAPATPSAPPTPSTPSTPEVPTPPPRPPPTPSTPTQSTPATPDPGRPEGSAPRSDQGRTRRRAVRQVRATRNRAEPGGTGANGSAPQTAETGQRAEHSSARPSGSHRTAAGPPV